MTLQTRAQAKSRQDIMNEVLAIFASRPGPGIKNSNFSPYDGFNPPTDGWLNTLRSIRSRKGDDVLAINVEVKMHPDWNIKEYGLFEVFLVSQDVQGNVARWNCGMVRERYL